MLRWYVRRRRRRVSQSLLLEVAVEQGELVRTLIDERAALVQAGEAPPLPVALLAQIEGGWVAMDRMADAI